ncbi:hypothetical protein WJX81_001193 [Elliptochloris bilobata]|uniref:Uncharacterized protein n=1 Tax=Elliptochloris bilobata TaxID=381761 RepID=A0AAW1S769_9CHLO
MAFVMSLPRTKRLKYLNDAGQEVFQEDDRWHFLRAADPTAQVPEDAAGDTEEADSGRKAATTPWQALEKFQAARGEVEVLLDLVAAVEAGEAVAVANVPPRKSTLEGLTTARALLVQTKQRQLQDAAARLRRGARALEALLWRTVRQGLEAEAARMDGGTAGHALAGGLAACAGAEALGQAALAPLLLQLHLAVAEGRAAGALRHAAAWLRHAYLRAHVQAVSP